jgi:hypothetical protein
VSLRELWWFRGWNSCTRLQSWWAVCFRWSSGGFGWRWGVRGVHWVWGTESR